MGIGAGISAVGSLASGIFQQSADQDAAQAEAQAAQQAAAYSKQIYSDAQTNLSPYMATGSGASTQLGQRLGDLTNPFMPTQSQLESSPGYQFNLTQGLKATQNSAAARGLGVSGAALKGASTYATGLADSTLKTQYDIDQGNKTNSYNKLLGTSTLGSSAAGTLGSIGNTSASGTANSLLTGAQGQASADIAAGGAFNSLLGNAGDYFTTAKFGSSYAKNNKLTSLF